MAEVKGEVEKKSNTNKEMVNVPGTFGNTLTASQTQELSDKGFLDILYEKIADVLGGDNPNQYLCLTLPGTIINPEKYKYDLSGVKPAHVKANESRLVNKLFDACFITGADNGKMLPNQYKTALSMLSPKLNKDLFELKNQLRKVLMTPYPYDFGEGVVYDLNVEQVFYRLYNDYVEEKAKWSKAQLAKKAELEDLIIDPVAREDKYLEWYGAVAESERVHLEEKRGRVLSVFSPDDMNIINAILNCGVGGEIEQARSTLDMVEELSPDGGYIYPVSLYPDNWFELLESSFTGMDLLESPAALSQKLRTLQLQRKNVLSQIGRLASTIPSDEKMKSTKEKFEKANQEYRKGVQNCTDTNLNVTKEVASAIVDLCMMDGEGNAMVPDQDTIERVTNKETKDGQKIKKSDIQAIIEKIGKNAIACSRAQTDAVAAGEECAKAAIEWCGTKNQMQMKKLLLPLQSNLGSLNDEIEELKSQIQISRAANKPEEGGSSEEAIAADVMPNKSDDYFTQVIIDTTMSDWLLDYIEVEEPTSSKKSKFKISEWIEDTNKHDYYDRSLIKVEDAEVKERNIKSEARYSVPANAKVSITDSTTVEIGYQMFKIKISEIDTKTSVSTELKLSKEGGKTFNLSQLVSTISFALETTNRTEEKADISHTIEKKVEQSITFPVIDKNQEYRPIYIENYEDCKIQVGNFVLEVPRILSRRGAGYEAI